MNNIHCRNCGKRGHKYKDCKNPRLSYGIILYNDDKQIIMIERKDSISFIEFIRGKYPVKGNDYIQLLFNRMSVEERDKVKNDTFQELWNGLWYNFNECKKDYNNSIEKFINIDKEYFINSCDKNYEYNEWEIPKGRRNLGETNKQCAIREFNEETNVKFEDYVLYENVLPLEEEYIGSNNIRYKNVYYIGKIKDNKKELKINLENKEQISEVKSIKWLSKDECLNHIRDYSDYKMNVVKQIFNFIDSDKNNIIL